MNGPHVTNLTVAEVYNLYLTQRTKNEVRFDLVENSSRGEAKYLQVDQGPRNGSLQIRIDGAKTAKLKFQLRIDPHVKLSHSVITLPRGTSNKVLLSNSTQLDLEGPSVILSEKYLHVYDGKNVHMLSSDVDGDTLSVFWAPGSFAMEHRSKKFNVPVGQVASEANTLLCRFNVPTTPTTAKGTVQSSTIRSADTSYSRAKL